MVNLEKGLTFAYLIATVLANHKAMIRVQRYQCQAWYYENADCIDRPGYIYSWGLSPLLPGARTGSRTSSRELLVEASVLGFGVAAHDERQWHDKEAG